MAELDGLNMSLDDLISKRNEEERRKHGHQAGRGGGRGGRGPWQQREGRGGPWQGPGYRNIGLRSPMGGGGRGRGGRGPPGLPSPGPLLPGIPPLPRPFVPQREVMLGGMRPPMAIPPHLPLLIAPPPAPEPPPPPQLTAYVKPETQEVAVKFKQTEIMKVTESGSVKLDSGGFRGPAFLVAMNEALKVLGMKISGPSFSQWTVSDGRSITRYEDGLVLPAKGDITANRARDVLKAFTQNNTPKPPADPPALLEGPQLLDGFAKGPVMFLPPGQAAGFPGGHHNKGSNHRVVGVSSPLGPPGPAQGDWHETGEAGKMQKDRERRLRQQGRFFPY